MTQSVSFRITRTAEDVAQMLNALSQRLVKLEQRLESLELQVRQQRSEAETMPAEERQRLDDVDQLLLDCQELLNSTQLSSDVASDSAGALSQPSMSESEYGLKLHKAGHRWQNKKKADHGIHHFFNLWSSQYRQQPLFPRSRFTRIVVCELQRFL